jgi:hypothetical protein
LPAVGQHEPFTISLKIGAEEKLSREVAASHDLVLTMAGQNIVVEQRAVGSFDGRAS